MRNKIPNQRRIEIKAKKASIISVEVIKRTKDSTIKTAIIIVDTRDVAAQTTKEVTTTTKRR